MDQLTHLVVYGYQTSRHEPLYRCRAVETIVPDSISVGRGTAKPCRTTMVSLDRVGNSDGHSTYLVRLE
jgi:hypothetical protein